MAEISVILPVFNTAHTVARAVRSILEQTQRELELIVIDDGSTDDTVAIIGQIHDPRVLLVRAEHGGVAAAANLGLEHAQYEFIARMDADDYAYPERLQKQLALLRGERLDAVGCQVRIVDERGELAMGMARYERWINEETLAADQITALRFVEFPLVNPTILARRAYFQLGFREGDFPEDYDLMLRAANSDMRFDKVPEVLLDWTDRATGLTRSNPRYSPAAFDRCRRMHLLDGPLQGATEVDLWGVGRTGKQWLRWLQEIDVAVRRAYDVNERQLGQTVHGVCVEHPDAMHEADGTLLLIGVGADGARDLIRPHLAERGFVAGQDAWFVA